LSILDGAARSAFRRLLNNDAMTTPIYQEIKDFILAR